MGRCLLPSESLPWLIVTRCEWTVARCYCIRISWHALILLPNAAGLPRPVALSTAKRRHLDEHESGRMSSASYLVATNPQGAGANLSVPCKSYMRQSSDLAHWNEGFADPASHWLGGRSCLPSAGIPFFSSYFEENGAEDACLSRHIFFGFCLLHQLRINSGQSTP